MHLRNAKVIISVCEVFFGHVTKGAKALQMKRHVLCLLTVSAITPSLPLSHYIYANMKLFVVLCRCYECMDRQRNTCTNRSAESLLPLLPIVESYHRAAAVAQKFSLRTTPQESSSFHSCARILRAPTAARQFLFFVVTAALHSKRRLVVLKTRASSAKMLKDFYCWNPFSHTKLI